MMGLSTEEMQQLISELNGSSLTIEECLPHGLGMSDLTDANMDELNQVLFLCSVCDYWHELSEEAEASTEERRICEDCI